MHAIPGPLVRGLLALIVVATTVGAVMQRPATALPPLTYTVHTVVPGRDANTAAVFGLPTLVDVDGNLLPDHVVNLVALPSIDLATGALSFVVRFEIGRLPLVPPMNALIEAIVAPDVDSNARMAVGYDARTHGPSPEFFGLTTTIPADGSRVSATLNTTRPGPSLDLLAETWDARLGRRNHLGATLTMTPVPATLEVEVARPNVSPLLQLFRPVTTLAAVKVSTPLPVVLDASIRLNESADKRTISLGVNALPAARPGVPSIAANLYRLGSGDGRRVEIRTAAPIREVRASVSATEGAPLADRIRIASVVVRDLPTRLTVDVTSEARRISMTTEGGPIGSIDAALTDGSAASLLPDGTDGFRVVDRGGVFTAVARISGLTSFVMSRDEPCRTAAKDSTVEYCTDEVRVVVDTVGNRRFLAELLTRTFKDEYVTGVLDAVPNHLEVRLRIRKYVARTPGVPTFLVTHQTEVEVVATPQPPGGLSLATNAGDRDLLWASMAPVPTGARLCVNVVMNGCAGNYTWGTSFSVSTVPAVTINAVDCKVLSDCGPRSRAPWMRIENFRLSRLDVQLVDSFDTFGRTYKGIFVDTNRFPISGGFLVSDGSGADPISMTLGEGSWAYRRYVGVNYAAGNFGFDNVGLLHCGTGTSHNLGRLVDVALGILCNA